VEGGFHRLREVINVVVTSVLQTAAGRMIFARLDSPFSGDNHSGVDSRKNTASSNGGRAILDLEVSHSVREKA
jgi:hypothetical protein